MRFIVIACMLLAAPLGALDVQSIDGETLRYTRYVLLQDEVRNHFKLRIGAFEPLDQAILLDADLHGKSRKVVALRLGNELACVVMKTGDDEKIPEHWTFIEVEDEIEAKAGAGGIIVTSNVDDEDAPDIKERARYLKLKDDALRVMLTYVSKSETSYQDGRYVVRTTSRLTNDNFNMQLKKTTKYLLDDEPVPEGTATATYDLIEKVDSLKLKEISVKRFTVSTHCKIARRLEREGLNEAALFHAREAETLAKVSRLDASDPRNLDAISLVAKLEARLRA